MTAAKPCPAAFQVEPYRRGEKKSRFFVQELKLMSENWRHLGCVESRSLLQSWVSRAYDAVMYLKARWKGYVVRGASAGVIGGSRHCLLIVARLAGCQASHSQRGLTAAGSTFWPSLPALERCPWLALVESLGR